MYSNGYDCINKCEFEYGKNNKCNNCEYYKNNEAELEIDRCLEKMEYAISQCETDYEEELFTNDNFKL